MENAWQRLFPASDGYIYMDKAWRQLSMHFFALRRRCTIYSRYPFYGLVKYKGCNFIFCTDTDRKSVRVSKPTAPDIITKQKDQGSIDSLRQGIKIKTQHLHMGFRSWSGTIETIESSNQHYVDLHQSQIHTNCKVNGCACALCCGYLVHTHSWSAL